MNEPTEGINSNRSIEAAISELILRTLGPAADATGAELARIPEFIGRNLRLLLESCKQKLGNRSVQPGGLSPRLLTQVGHGVMYADDEIIPEYLGGVLAASSLRKDRGVAAVSIIRSLSSLQLRAHYLVYAELLRLVPAIDHFDLRLHSNTRLVHIEIPLCDFLDTLGIGSTDADERDEVCDHVTLGLSHTDLISHFGWGRSMGRELDDQGQETHIVFHPSPLGAELFLWGRGSKTVNQARLFNPSLDLIRLEEIAPISSAKLGTDYFSPGYGSDFELALRNHDLDKAKSMALEVVSRYPGSAEGHFYLSICAALDGDELQAVRLASKCTAMTTHRVADAGAFILKLVMISYPSKENLLMQIAAILRVEARVAETAT